MCDLQAWALSAVLRRKGQYTGPLAPRCCLAEEALGSVLLRQRGGSV